jgi:hypothetical protein
MSKYVCEGSSYSACPTVIGRRIYFPALQKTKGILKTETGCCLLTAPFVKVSGYLLETMGSCGFGVEFEKLKNSPNGYSQQELIDTYTAP